MLSPKVARQIRSAVIQLKKNTGTEIAVLTLKNLEGLSIEQASIQVVDHWKLGSAEKDNGVLLLIAQEERQIRIEVGRGLEGNLTDAYSKRIISEIMVPLFRSGDVNKGVLLGVLQIAQRAHPDIDVSQLFGTSAQQWTREKRQGRGFSFVSLFFLLLVLSSLFGGGRRGGGMSYLLTGILLGGMGGGRRYGGGGFGSGGGSFGGGGGSFGGGGGFSGGGASGGW